MRTINPIAVLTVLLLAIAGAYMIATVNPTQTLLVALGILILIIAVLKTEVALYILIFSMLLSPEIPVASTPGRDVVIRLDDLILFLITFSWFVKSAIYKEIGFLLQTPLNRPILIYLGVCLVSTALGILFGRVELLTGIFFFLKFFEFYLVYFMVVNNIKDEKQVKRFLVAMIITAIIVSITAMLQIPKGVRVTAPFEGEQGEPNTLGGYLVIITSICLGLFTQLKKIKIKLVFLALVILFTIPLIYTFSRSSWSALLPMFAVVGYFSTSRARILFICGSVLLLFSLPFIVPEKARARFAGSFSGEEKLKKLSKRKQQKMTKVGDVALDESSSLRLMSYNMILHDVREHLLFGFGIAGYGFIDGQYFRTLAETGIFGLIALLNLIYSIMKIFYQRYKLMISEFNRAILIGMMATCAAMAMHAVTGNTFMIVRIMEPFWFLAAIAITREDVAIHN
jgi:hypothetical protein